MAYFSNLVTPQQSALQNKAGTSPNGISLPNIFGSWQYSGLPKYNTSQPAPNATSVATKQPTYMPPAQPSAPAVAPASANPNANAIAKAHTATLTALTGNSTPPASAPPTNAGTGMNPYTYQNGQWVLGGDPSTAGTPTPNPAPPATNASQNVPPNFGGILGGLVGSSQRNPAIGQNAAEIGAEYAKRVKDTVDTFTPAAIGYQGAGLSPIAGGLATQMFNAQSARLAGLSAAEQAALAGTGQQLTGASQEANALGTAGGLIPEALRYGTTGGGGALDPNTQIQSLAQAVAGGGTTGMDYGTAYSQLSSAYGPVIANQLLPAIQKINPNFNVALSKASVGTQATGQQIAAAIPPANQALDALQIAFNGLSSLQQGNVPLLNMSVPILGQLAQGASLTLGPGRTAASNFQGALAEARARIDGALQGIIGVDAAAAQANALLPDNMVPSELPGKIAAAKQYLQNQLQSYTSSGQQPSAGATQTTTPSTGGGLIQTPYGAINPSL